MDPTEVVECGWSIGREGFRPVVVRRPSRRTLRSTARSSSSGFRRDLAVISQLENEVGDGPCDQRTHGVGELLLLVD